MLLSKYGRFLNRTTSYYFKPFSSSPNSRHENPCRSFVQRIQIEDKTKTQEKHLHKEDGNMECFLVFIVTGDDQAN